MEEEKSSKLIPGSIAALWLLAFGSCLFYLFYLDGEGDDVATQEHGVAEIAQSGGEVETRGENAMLWSKAGKGRQLAQGSHLSTGEKSQVYVRFRDGRRMRLGAHTQIVISEEIKDGESTLVVSLVSGSLTALPPAPEAGRKRHPGHTVALVIRSEGRSMHLDHLEDHAELTKVPGRSAQVVMSTPGLAMVPEAPKPAAPASVSALERPVEQAPPLKAPLGEVPQLPPAPKPDTVAAIPTPPPTNKTPPAMPKQRAATITKHQAVTAAANPAALQAPPAPVVAASVPPPTVKPISKEPVPLITASVPPPVIKTAPKEPQPLPPAPAAPQVLDAKGLEPQLVGLDPEAIYWTEASLRGATGTSLQLKLAPPARGLPKAASWQPFIKAEVAGMEPVRVLGVKGGEQTLQLPLANLNSAGPYVAVKITIGAIIRRAATKQRAVVVTPGPTVTLASFSDLAKAGPIDVQIVAGGAGESTSPGWWAKGPTSAGAPLRIHLASGKDLKRLRSLLHAAKGLNVALNGHWPTQKGYSFVRASRVVATASGAASGLAEAKALAQDLGANLAFLGPASAFIAEPDGDGDFISRIAAKGWAKHLVYIYDRRPGDPTYSMHALTLTANSDIAQYVGEGADAVFAQPVDLLPLASH